MTSWAIAVRRPSASAPSRILCTVGVRYPTPENICWRVSANFTGRPSTICAASAARMVLACGRPLDPNPPPT